MPVEVLEVTRRFMRDPIRILVKKEELTLEGIRQFYVMVEKEVCFWFALLSVSSVDTWSCQEFCSCFFC